MKMCNHKWVFLQSRKFKEYDGQYNTHYTRVDEFFCDRCLKYKEKVFEDWKRDTPDWYK